MAVRRCGAGYRYGAVAAPPYDERPARSSPRRAGWEYERRVAEIPMRDGVKLHTVILVPKGASGAPILLTRTPYNAEGLTTNVAAATWSPRSTATTTPPT